MPGNEKSYARKGVLACLRLGLIGPSYTGSGKAHRESIVIRVAPLEQQQLNDVAHLFDLYRQFYQEAPDPQGCHSYLEARSANDESTVLVANHSVQGVVGFTQLYDSFCSVAMRPIVYLYDLFVLDSMRKQGIGRQLMNAAKDYSKRRSAVRLTLETQHANRTAQRLYESLGYQRDAEFCTYHLELTNGH